MIPPFVTRLALKAIGIPVGFVLDRLLGEAEAFEHQASTRPCARCVERDSRERDEFAVRGSGSW